MKLRLHNFSSFRECTVELPTAPGLYFMRGENRAEARLGANGAGKSTLWAALHWLLYGKTPKGLRAGDAANWSSETARVELTWDITQFTRSWSPNFWRAVDLETGESTDLGDDKLNPLLSRVGMNQQAFLNCVLMSQKEPMFLDLKPEAKSTLFSDVLDLSRYLELSERASKKSAELNATVRSTSESLAYVEGQISSMDVNRRKQFYDDAETHRADSLKAQKRRQEELEQQLASLKAELAQAHKTADFKPSPTELNRVKKDFTEVSALCASLKTELRLLLEQDDLCIKHERCPTCDQRLDTDEARRASQQRERKIDGLRRKLAEAEHLKEEIAHDVDKLARAEQALRSAVDRAQATQEVLERNIRQYQQELETLTADMGKRWVNPHKRALDEMLFKLDSLNNKRDELKRKLDEVSTQQMIHDFWIKGFKDLRLQQIATALVELEIEVNNSLSELGLTEWQIKFDVDRETKSGTIQRGFAVTVKSPHNDRPVPWEAWSGGEAQRLRVACNMGLANLIRSRSQCQLNLEVWDEPTAGMTQQGINDLMETLAIRAEAEQRVIWVVDHHSLGFGGFTGTCTVIKDRGGSRVEWQM